MDFRTCPACKASVLEDDAVDCPFCGASMTTGKPSGQAQPTSHKPAPPKPAAAAPAPAAKPGAGKATPAGKSPSPARSAAKTKDDGADPFDVDTSAARKATPVRPRPAKGYMIRIACPMCERAGFISEAEIGKEVKCCNPDCLVPVFVANPPREKGPEPEPVASGSGRMWLYGLLGLAVVGGVTAVVVLNNRKPVTGTGPILPPANGTVTGGSPAPPTPNPEPPTPGPVPVKTLTSAEIIARSLTEMEKAADQAEGLRERDLAARLIAEARVLNGDAAAARNELAALGTASRYAAIGPLAIDAWKQLAAGKTTEAKAAVDEAWALQASLPQRGREALDMAANLAAALVATGRVDDARTFVLGRNDPEAGEIAAQWRAAVAGNDYRFDDVAQRTCLQELPHPLWAAVTQTLAGNGQFDVAQTWSLAAPDEVARDNCSAVLATQAAAKLGSGADLTARVDALTAELPAAGQARVWSGVGQGLLERDDKAGAQAAADKAQAALASISLGAPVAIPELKALYELSEQPDRGLPSPLAGRSAAMAAFDLSELQSRLGQAAAAAQTLDLMLQLLRSTAPSAAGTGALVEELTGSTTQVRDRLKQALGLDDSVIVSRFSKYQTQVRTWDERARERRDLETRLLARVAIAGDLVVVWKLVQAAQTSADPATAQAYYSTDLPGLLYQFALTRGVIPVSQGIQAAFPDAPPAATPTDRLRATLSPLNRQVDWKKAAPELANYYKRPPADRALADSAALRAIAQLVEVEPAAALTAAGQLPDTLLREDALWLIGARGTARQQAQVLLDKFEPRNFPKGAAMSMYRGCIDAASRTP